MLMLKYGSCRGLSSVFIVLSFPFYFFFVVNLLLFFVLFNHRMDVEKQTDIRVGIELGYNFLNFRYIQEACLNDRLL